MVGDVLPAPIRVSRAGIWNFAEAAATKLNFRPGDSIEPLVSRLGGRIEYKDVPGTGEVPESIVVRSARDFTIFLPTMTSPGRNRFTIAHELGHLFLHYPGVKRQTPNARMVARRWVDENDVDQQRAEWEANWFAAAFLMPREIFTSTYNRRGARDAAVVFGVSVQSAQIRAKSLGLEPV